MWSSLFYSVPREGGRGEGGEGTREQERGGKGRGKRRRWDGAVDVVGGLGAVGGEHDLSLVSLRLLKHPLLLVRFQLPV